MRTHTKISPNSAIQLRGTTLCAHKLLGLEEFADFFHVLEEVLSVLDVRGEGWV